MHFFNYLFFFLTAPNFLALATTLENLGARWLLAKKANFMPCTSSLTRQHSFFRNCKPSSTNTHIRSCTMNQAYLQIKMFKNVSQRRMLLRMINALANRSLTCHSSSSTNPCTITYKRRQRKSFNQLVT